MIEQIKALYKDNGWFRVMLGVGLLSGMVILYGLSGGFPPWAWRFLLDVLPQVPQLWRTQGHDMLIPLMALALYSLSLLALWVTLVTFAIKMGLYWFQQRTHGDSFEQDLQEAEALSDDMAEQMIEREWYGMERAEEPFEQERPIPVMAPAQPLYAVAGGYNPPARYQPPPVGPFATAASSSTVYPVPVPAPPHKTRLESPAARAFPASPAPRTMPLEGVTTSQRRERLRIVPPARPAQPSEDEPDEEEMEREGLAMPQNYSTVPDLDLEEFDQPALVEASQRVAGADRSAHADRLAQSARPVAVAPPVLVHQELSQASTRPVQSVQGGELRLVTGIGLDPGLARKNAPNEDSLIAFQCTRPCQNGPEPAGLFVVADGMGGHANGQEASRLAIQTVSEAIVPALLGGASEQELFKDLLKDAVHRANLAIYQRNRQQAYMMGTTMTAALVIGTDAYIANVGDSRTYLYHEPEGLQAITRDHSLVASLLADGVITAEEVYTHPKRNQIYRCLGEHATVQVDTFRVSLQCGDLLLLCSDGLWEMVRDSQMEEIIRHSIPHASQISSELVQAALNQGGADNISIIAACLNQVD